MLFFAIVMMVCALVFYTTSIWAFMISRQLESWMMALFGIAFVCDICGTIAMASLTSGYQWTVHGIIGWLALMLMLAMLWALSIAYFDHGRFEYRMRWFAMCAWVLWVGSFFSALL